MGFENGTFKDVLKGTIISIIVEGIYRVLCITYCWLGNLVQAVFWAFEFRDFEIICQNINIWIYIQSLKQYESPKLIFLKCVTTMLAIHMGTKASVLNWLTLCFMISTSVERGCWTAWDSLCHDPSSKLLGVPVNPGNCVRFPYLGKNDLFSVESDWPKKEISLVSPNYKSGHRWHT